MTRSPDRAPGAHRSLAADGGARGGDRRRRRRDGRGLAAAQGAARRGGRRARAGPLDQLLRLWHPVRRRRASSTGGVERLVARSPEAHRRSRHRRAHSVTRRWRSTWRRGEVEVDDRDGETYRLGYDQLLIATGGTPIRPAAARHRPPVRPRRPDPGRRAPTSSATPQAGCQRVVVVGSGYIGLEMAEAFVERGCTATVVERAAQPMGTLDPDMGAARGRGDGVPRHRRSASASTVTRLRAGGGAHLGRGRSPPIWSCWASASAPSSGLARRPAWRLGVKGAIRVDRRQETSSDGVWAAGDCCESHHLVTRQPVHLAARHLRQQAEPRGRHQHRRRPRGLPRSARHGHHQAVRHRDRPHRPRRGARPTGPGFDVVAARIESTTTAGLLPRTRRR